MATTTPKDPTGRIQHLNEQFVESGRKAGLALVDSYEKGWKGIADLQEKVGEETRIEWVQSLTHAQARFTRELTDAYSGAARGLFRN